MTPMNNINNQQKENYHHHQPLQNIKRKLEILPLKEELIENNDTKKFKNMHGNSDFNENKYGKCTLTMDGMKKKVFFFVVP
jgi:hypothetical protein